MGQRVRFVVVGIPPPGGVSMLSGKLKLGGIEEEERKAFTAVAPRGPAERHQGKGGEQEEEGEEVEFSLHPQPQLEEALPLFLPLSSFSSFPPH
jgi:hypothetical protein